MKHFIATFWAVLACLVAAAQTSSNSDLTDAYAPTPKALEMTRFGHLPADLNSGTVSIDIPVYTYEDKDFTIPIVLHYNTSGLIPYRQTEEAGLHWSLMAGGAITREIVGKDDFKSGGIYGNRNGLDDRALYRMEYEILWNSGYEPWAGNQTLVETTSDIYRFSFLGHSGSFVFLHDGKSISVYGTRAGRGTYRVEYEGGNNSCFTITTGDGFRYRFGYSPEYSSQSAKEQMWQQPAKYDGDTGYDHTSESLTTVTWLLDRIEAPNGRTVHFQYVTRRRNHSLPLLDEDVVTSFRKRMPGVNSLPNGRRDTYYKSASMTYTSYLRRIVVDSLAMGGGKMVTDFVWEKQPTREVFESRPSCYRDLVIPLRKLKRIRVYLGGELRREATLAYKVSGLRPLLKTVSIDGIGAYEMDYVNEGTPLPDMLTNGIDFWGYYNGRDDLGENSVSALGPNPQSTVPDEYVISDFQNPSWAHSASGCLQTIHYPTGGQTDIGYEAHRARNILLRRKEQHLELEPVEQDVELPAGEEYRNYLPSLYPVMEMLQSNECGGVRISCLTDNDGTGNLNTRSFSYCDSLGRSTGIIQQFPRYSDGTIYGFLSFNPFAVYPGSSFDQLPIAYSEVTEIYADGSSSTTTFSDWESDPDTYSMNRQLTQFSQPDPPPSFPLSEWQVFMDNILREPDSQSYRRGLPIKIVLRDIFGRTVQKEEIIYADYPADLFTAYVVGSGRYWWSARRFLCDRLPATKETATYMGGDSTHRVSRVFQYDSRNLLALEKENVRGEERTTAVLYSGDSTLVAPVYSGMRDRGILSIPVETVQYRDGRVFEANLTQFGQFGELYLPAAEHRAVFSSESEPLSFQSFNGNTRDDRYDSCPERFFVRYDSVGNLLLAEDRSGLPTTYIWTPDGCHPAAIIPGARIPYERRDSSDTVQNYSEVLEPGSFMFEDFECIDPFSMTLGIDCPEGQNWHMVVWLDGVSYPLTKINSTYSGGNWPEYSQNPSSCQIMVPAGGHRVRVNVGMTYYAGQSTAPIGCTLTFNYREKQYTTTVVPGQTVVFEDFEEDGNVTTGFNSEKSRRGSWTHSLEPASSPYRVDYRVLRNGRWEYKSVQASGTSVSINEGSSPIDHVRIYPGGSLPESYTWNADGTLRSRTDARGVTESYVYDGLGRLTGVYDNEGNKVEGYQYNYKNR